MKSATEFPARIYRANRVAQFTLAVAIAGCVAFGRLAAHDDDPSAKLAGARSTSGLPGPFLHGLIPGRTSLVQAILSRKTTLALSLLHSGDPEQVSAADALGWTPLIAAAYRGDIKVTAALLQENASTAGSTRTGKSALLYAIQAGHAEIATKLLAYSADPNTADKAGATPLMWAALHGDETSCSRLIAAGADIDRIDKRGYTALSIATLSESDAVVKQLLANHANTAIGAGNGDDLPLATALDTGDAANANALIAAGAPVNTRTLDGFTPLMLAVQNRLPRATVDLLIGHGADVAAMTSDGTTALCYACAAPHGSVPIVRDLLQHGASIMQSANDQTTPLMYATEAGNGDIVNLLLANGADEHVVTNRGMTALRWAVGEGYAANLGATLARHGDAK